MSESELQSEILTLLAHWPGVKAWRNNRGRRGYVQFGGPDGCSDILGWYKPPMGRAIPLAIEVKAPGARSDPQRLHEQVAFIEELTAAGGIGILARSTWDVERRLREEGAR